MKESDWKKFKKIREAALDRFCANALADFDATIHKPDTSNHDRYLDLYRKIHRVDKELSRLFDGNSRSMASLKLMYMRGEDLVTDEELEGLSDEFRESTKPL